jgi:hypothetical protein
MNKKIRMAALAFAILTGTVGYAAAQNYGYDNRDRDDGRYYDADDYRYENRSYDRDNRHSNWRQGMRAARSFGFRDGAQVAREDTWRGKPFNPNPRGRYDDADHGYSRSFGDKREYRQRYAEAYRQGYQNSFRGYGNGNGNGYYR